MLKRLCAITGALVVSAATCAHAQQAAADDTRTQYPRFLANSFFSVNVGSMGYLFTDRQLEPGFHAESIEKPRLAVRLDLFGHRFTKHLSVQATYLRPVQFVKYKNINGDSSSSQVSNAFGGITLVGDVPLTARVSAYVEGGGGITSRSGFDSRGQPALLPAHYTAGLLGAGLAYHASPRTDVVFGATYSPVARRSASRRRGCSRSGFDTP